MPDSTTVTGSFTEIGRKHFTYEVKGPGCKKVKFTRNLCLFWLDFGFHFWIGDRHGFVDIIYFSKLKMWTFIYHALSYIHILLLLMNGLRSRSEMTSQISLFACLPIRCDIPWTFIEKSHRTPSLFFLQSTAGKPERNSLISYSILLRNQLQILGDIDPSRVSVTTTLPFISKVPQESSYQITMF